MTTEFYLVNGTALRTYATGHFNHNVACVLINQRCYLR